MKKILLIFLLSISSLLMADDIIGSLVGGAIGGVVGHQIGRGNGKTAATIGGAVIGTMIGNSANSSNYNDRHYRKGTYTNNGYSNSQTRQYIGYTQPQPIYYEQAQQVVYVQQRPQVIYVRHHHDHDDHDDHDDDDHRDNDNYGRGDGYREIRMFR